MSFVSETIPASIVLTGPGPLDTAPAATREHSRAQTLPPGWLERLQQGDRTALAALVRQFGGELTRIAFLQLGDAHAAEDAVQDTFLAAWDAARRVRGGSSARTWLIGILLNRCRKHRRTLGRRRRREHAAARAADGPHEQHALEQDETIRALRAALTQLDHAQRSIVVLRHLQGLSVSDTAQLLRIPPGTVKSRCHSAIARLRQLMEEVSP